MTSEEDYENENEYSSTEQYNDTLIFNTIVEMFKQRGYIDIEYDDKLNILSCKKLKVSESTIDANCSTLDKKIIRNILYKIKKNLVITNEISYDSIVASYVSGVSAISKYSKCVSKIISQSLVYVCAFCNICVKLNTNQITNFITDMEKYNIHYSIVIYDVMTPQVKNVIAECRKRGIFITPFKSNQLLYNITKHSLVPKHEELTSEEVAELKKTCPDIGKLPVMDINDPIALFYNYSVGTVVKIYRKGNYVFENGESSTMIAYRVVK
jgi:DNA-directed RNA polymerase subunit H (RpoH/RPB5)